MSLVKTFWNQSAEPENTTLANLLYNIRKDDQEGLIYDHIEIEDIESFAEEFVEYPIFDALVTPYSQLERKMNIIFQVMQKAGGDVKATSVEVSKPFKKYGTVQVGVVFTMSDEQTVTIFLHNPDTTPTKLTPKDELVSWKWLINKKDVTIVVAPEQGKDLNVREVARRIMKLVNKNSAAFLRQNAKLRERKEKIEAAEKNIQDKEKLLSSLLEEIKLLEGEVEERKVTLKKVEAKQAEIEAQRKAEEEARKKAEEEARKKAEEEARKKAEAEAKAKEEEERKKAEEAKKAAEKTAPANEDEAFLKGVIAGTVDPNTDENMARLETIAESHDKDGDPLLDLVNQALDVLAGGAVNEAQKALAA